MNIISPKKKQTNATKILALVKGFEVFNDPSGTAWIGLPSSNGYSEYVPLRSGRFSGWVARRFLETYGATVGQKAIDDARAVLSGIAADVVKQVYVRVANLGDVVFIDLGNRYVEITVGGWQFTDKPPVPFRRPAGMLPLPEPAIQYEGRLEDTLGEVLGMSGSDLLLIVAWTIGTYNTCDYPILVLNGEQGSGKSTISEILKSLIDPAEVTLRAVPRDEQGLAVAANNSWLVALDNLSSVPDWLSDALCRISTGAGYSARRLYFDLDEVFAKTQRPVILNGIPELATRGDLQDRSIVITLSGITDIQRRSKENIMNRFQELLPVMLGQVFDAIRAALALKGRMTIPNLPRMADFALWAAGGITTATYSSVQDFVNVYESNRQDAVLALLDVSPLGQELQEFAAKQRRWTGTTTDLRDKLILQALGTPTEQTLQKMTVKALNNELRRLAPVLRRVGVSIEFQGLKKVSGVVGRFIEIADLSTLQGVKVP
ncbi:MAG: hypothetical protein ACPLUL_05935 [Thermanaerothrix sp.]|uniref:hypothetical protein n=1 Tax=Thermanaerothrix sp. TaxID=2972675 RepID=UPI003C7C2FB5